MLVLPSPMSLLLLLLPLLRPRLRPAVLLGVVAMAALLLACAGVGVDRNSRGWGCWGGLTEAPNARGGAAAGVAAAAAVAARGEEQGRLMEVMEWEEPRSPLLLAMEEAGEQQAWAAMEREARDDAAEAGRGSGC